MDILQAAILGVVEGITEFLPISSTAHLALTSKILGLEQNDFMKSFEIGIQSGAILAVLYLYWHKIFKNKQWLIKIMVAFVPTGIIGLILYGIIKSLFLSNYVLMLWSLIVGGILMIWFELIYKDSGRNTKDIAELSYGKCLCIGTFQALAVIPGVSRAAATIIGGLLLNINRKVIVEFSFLLAVPTMFLATLYDLSRSSASFSASEVINLSVGFVVSFIVAVFAIRFLLNYIRHHNFVVFGVYRIIIALIFLLFVL